MDFPRPSSPGHTREDGSLRLYPDAIRGPLVRSVHPEILSNTNDTTKLQTVAAEPDPRDAELAALRAELEAERAKPPIIVEKIVEVEKIVHAEVPAPVVEPAPPPPPYVPDFTLIPDQLAKYAEADESAEDFRKRAFSILFRFGIAEGENFEGGGEPLSPEEKIRLLPMLIANFAAGNWLNLTEDLKP